MSTFNSLYILWHEDYRPSQGVPLHWFQARNVQSSSSVFIQVHPQRIAWPLLVLGLTWPGALIALWMGLRWGPRVVTASLLFSFLAIGLGTLLAEIGLVCQAAAGTRRWLRHQVEARAI